MRAHVVMPPGLVEAVDRLVGKRRRSRFFAEAVEEKLARARRIEAAREAAGTLAELDIPGWETPESAAAWVHDLRRSSDARVGSEPNRSS